jgi:hypothetical protein
MMMAILVLLQIVHVLFLSLHDWVPIPPWNDVNAAQERDGVARLAVVTAISTAPFALGLIFTLTHLRSGLPVWVLAWLWGTYGLLLLGALRAWWWPYLVRSEPALVARHSAMFSRTHSFLPERNGISPNSLHCGYHAFTAGTLVVIAMVTIWGR